MKGSLKTLPHSRSSMGSGSSGPSVVGKSSLTSDEFKKLQQDLGLLSARLAQGNPVTASSSVVGDLRSTVADARSSSPASSASNKTEMLDEILRKIAELDRSVLKKTEPIASNEHARPRRNSNTVDLYCLPTHFQVIDRLVDLHAQSKRPVIIHQHNAASSAASAASNVLNEEEVVKLKAKHDSAIASINGKLREVETKLIASESKLSKYQTDYNELKKQNETLSAEIISLKAAAQLPVPVPVSSSTNEAELAAMAQKHADALKTMRAMEERVERAAGGEQTMCNALIRLAKNIQDDKSLGKVDSYFVDERENPRLADSFGKLLAIAADRIDGFKLDLVAAATNAQIIENEMSSVKLEKQMIADDYNSMTVSFNSLRVAFSEMESESIQLRVRLESKEKNGGEAISKAAESELLAFRSTANAEISRLRKSLEDLESIMSEREREVSRYNSHIAMLEQQLQEYKDLTDKLKVKIREITPLDKRELLDSFEEVMRDEMMTMKGAFESKLKMAKGELELLSKKHQQDIQRIKESSISKIPLPSYK